MKATKDAELSKKVEQVAQSLIDLSFEYNGLFIRPCMSQSEMIAEGETLGHCVGKNGYDEKMAKRQTAIFLIREAKNPDTPYVTLELSLISGKVIQCYGKKDQAPSEKVKKFYKKWEREIVASKLKQQKEAKTA